MKVNPQRITKVRIYPICLFSRLDNWLKEMSKAGWHLVDYGIITYVFEKGPPSDKEYFSYSCSRIGDGKYDIALRHPLLNKTYGVKKKKSKLNSRNSFSGNTIIEIDTSRIDIENDLGYKELVSDRNRLYTMLTIRNSVVYGVILVILILAIILL